MFVIEDERHADNIGQFHSRDDAMAELRRLATLPWDREPNIAPCMDWETCGRSYEIIEFDASRKPWRELNRALVLEVSAEGVRWLSSGPGTAP